MRFALHKRLAVTAIAVAGLVFVAVAQPAHAQSDTETTGVPLRIEVPLEAPSVEAEARRSAYKGCYDWASATLESQRQVDSDRGLGSILGSDYQEFHSVRSEFGTSYEEVRLRMIDRCMREKQAEQANP